MQSDRAAVTAVTVVEYEYGPYMYDCHPDVFVL